MWQSLVPQAQPGQEGSTLGATVSMLGVLLGTQ